MDESVCSKEEITVGADVKDFRDFKVWEKAHELVLDIYKFTSDFPKHEMFGLVGQMRRCSSSIPAILLRVAGVWAILSCTGFCKFK